ncbi:hypothetical protein BLNAU_12513 [Blattamonas nauphoetae]|uniref:MULE transposase domain-containing protein n=1 Tax=Blattamonas nauphoetae TaxID=2049346 RepID=A0ABQ9XMD5_9EUKA|nr:hypothetical protein BLNAU_12513 [Blattamonas nauphoetae]
MANARCPDLTPCDFWLYFGIAHVLGLSETTQDYEWVFHQLKLRTDGLLNTAAFVTDDDAAIAAALKSTYPEINDIRVHASLDESGRP